MKTMLMCLLALFLSSASTAPSITSNLPGKTFSANPPRWEYLGQRRVDFSRDRDEIFVTARDGVFTAIKIRVKKAPIEMHRLIIHFANGTTQEIELRQNIPAGGSSRIIDLPGNKRIIQKVVFVYETKNRSPRRAVVELWGRH